MNGSALQEISIATLRTFKIAFPPTKTEQTTIGTVLSDVDSFINALQEAVTKKRLIKQGAMQELLSGRRRLLRVKAGAKQQCKLSEVGLIPDDWEVLAFDRVLQRLNAKNHQIAATDYQGAGTLPVIDQGKDMVVGFTDRLDKRFCCPVGGVIVFGDHTRVVKFVDFDFAVGADGTQVLAAKAGYSTRFLAYQLQNKEIPNTGYNRHFKYLKERLFPLPPTLAEQQDIANTLSDMDAEIAALEAKLAKAVQVKQGMMQALLSGRVRLV